jgi:hypothetical protein
MTLAAEPLVHDVVERLHSGQWVVHESQARYRVVVTGRRWGKTTLDRAEVMSEFGMAGLIWYLAPTYDMARELMWEPLKVRTPRAWLLSDPNETRMEMDTIWGCRLACKSVEHPDRLRGRGPRKIIGDEFQDWKDGQRTWEEVLLPSLLTSNGRALLTGTPKSFNHLYDAYRKGQDGVEGWASWQFVTADAPHINKQELARMAEEMDPRAFRQEFLASFESLAGRAYYAFNRAYHVRPVELVRGVPVCVSFDFNHHPATAIIGQKLGDHAQIWREVWVEYAGGEATKASATTAKDLLVKAGWTGPVRLYGDATGHSTKTTGPTDHAMIKSVFPGATWCIKTENPHVRDRVAAVNARCETMDGQRRLLVDPSCKHVISDYEQVIFKKNGDLDQDTNPMLTHISDASGYWIHSDFPVVKVEAAVGRARIERVM